MEKQNAADNRTCVGTIYDAIAWFLRGKNRTLDALLLFGIVSIVAYLLYAWGVFGFGTMPEIPLALSHGTVAPCEKKTKCVVVYLAPWCPFCQKGVAFFNEVHTRFEKNGTVGMKVVLGSDSTNKLEEMAKAIKAPVFFDPEGRFATLLEVQGYPSWWILNERGRIVERGSGLPQPFTFYKLVED